MPGTEQNAIWIEIASVDGQRLMEASIAKGSQITIKVDNNNAIGAVIEKID